MPSIKITSAHEAYLYLSERISSEVEEFWAIALNSEKGLIASQCLFRGTVDICLFHPRDVFRFACRHNASSLVVAHNHPSGSPLPSRQDMAVTHQLLQAADIMQITVVDHIILAGSRYFSFLDSGTLPVILGRKD